MNDKTIVYATYYNPIEANIIKARIEDSDFACFLADENVATLNPLYNQAIGGVKLIVFERDVEQIDKLLSEEFDNESFPAETSEVDAKIEEQTVCAKCSSINVAFGMATKKKHKWWVIAISFIMGIYPFKGNKCHHCYDCGYEFE